VRLRTSGMFRLEVVLNGHFRISALVDTGATSVYVCDRVAKSLKLKPGEVVTVRTTGGQVSALRTTIDTIQIGRIVIHDITAVVHPDDSDCNEILLGLSALRKFDSVIIRANTLILIGQGLAPNPRCFGMPPSRVSRVRNTSRCSKQRGLFRLSMIPMLVGSTAPTVRSNLPP
jgi:clan AA aspartic protease (TIGR02281 family)